MSYCANREKKNKKNWAAKDTSVRSNDNEHANKQPAVTDDLIHAQRSDNKEKFLNMYVYNMSCTSEGKHPDKAVVLVV